MNLQNITIRQTRPYLLVFSLFVMLLTSCERENIDIIVPDTPTYTPTTDTINDLINLMSPATNNFILLGCLKLDLPMQFISESGDTISVKNLAEVENALALTDELAIKDFVFPIIVDDQYLKFNVILNNRDLAQLYTECVPDKGWTESVTNGIGVPAFLPTYIGLDISYPVQLKAGNETFIANDELEFVLNKVAHPDLSFDIPLTMITDNGPSITIDNIEAFFNAVYQYTDVVPPYVNGNIMINGFGCNEIQFPINVKNENEEMLTINNVDEFAVLILTEDWMEVYYPFTVINESSGTVQINNLGNLKDVQALCGYDNEPIYACNTPAHLLFFYNVTPNLCYYTINYPVTIKVKGTLTEIINFNQYNTIRNTVDDDDIQLVYPISVGVNGTNRTYYSDADVCMYSKGC